ncbi:MAG: ATP-binding protein [bacterium]
MSNNQKLESLELITTEEVDKLFPFHFSVDEHMNVCEKGPSLEKLLHKNINEHHFSMLFKLVSPKTENNLNYSHLNSICGKYVVIEIKNIKGGLLKGSFDQHKSNGNLRFWGSLSANDHITLKAMGLTYSDFPTYDPIFDFHQLKSLLTEIYETRLRDEEEQRDTISRDLHDGVGQMLAYLNVYFNILREKENIELYDIEKVQITLRKIIDEIRRISRNLTPPAIKQLGFKEAVMELINSYAIIIKPKFHINMYKGQDPNQFLYEHKIMIFRIIQELSSNTFRYAKADNVDISIEIEHNELKLRYSDDGIGFDVKRSRKGVGIKSMLSRVEFYGGMITIDSQPQMGMTALVIIPLQ